ncbi:hypothetical protein K227x_51930 [Rubripirellula lacrimiformis]|uniref:Uncharacterized protein n=1 Tax=Rubripirellula lacrimiformis TaxID=1930273 RepID=A0A517NI11_9BACT|nr:hypothetical protein K227x_51930 [Rubripirellula lacrimiformis]
MHRQIAAASIACSFPRESPDVVSGANGKLETAKNPSISAVAVSIGSLLPPSQMVRNRLGKPQFLPIRPIRGFVQTLLILRHGKLGRSIWGRVGVTRPSSKFSKNRY